MIIAYIYYFGCKVMIFLILLLHYICNWNSFKENFSLMTCIVIFK